MKNFYTGFIFILLNFSVSAQITPNTNLKVYGYIVSWALNMKGLPGGPGAANYGNCPYQEIDYDACTDYIMFDAHFDSTGAMRTQIEWDGGVTWGPNPTMVQKRRPLNDYIHSQGKSISMTMFVDGGGGDWTTLLSTPAGRNAMIKTIVDSLIRPTYQYDGVHFDPEPFTGIDTANARIFFAQLRDTLNNYHQWIDTTKKPLLTVAIYGSPMGNFWASVSEYFDAILHMSYNMFGSWMTVTWYNAPVYSTGYEGSGYNVASIQSYTDYYINQCGIPRDKLVMACPFNYNAYMGGSTSGGEGCYAPLLTMEEFPIHVNTYEEMYYNCWMKYIDTATTTIHYDSIRKAAWVGYNNPGKDNDMLILFQDTTCIRENLEYISSAGLQGAMVWEICGGYLGESVPDSLLLRHPGLEEDHLLQAVKRTRYALMGSKITEKSDPSVPYYSLTPNHPNPFNCTTTIDYQLPVNSHITLKIYDQLGREIKTLVDEYKTTGSYSVKWDGTNSKGKRASSGTYFYQLQGEEGFVGTKKMVLVK
jgi:hypothetical protein